VKNIKLLITIILPFIIVQFKVMSQSSTYSRVIYTENNGLYANSATATPDNNLLLVGSTINNYGLIIKTDSAILKNT
jgi:hypothetical protein